MNRELEELLKAYDAYAQSKKPDSKKLFAAYQAQLDAVIAKIPTLSRTGLHSSILARYPAWVRAQRKPSTLPPNA
jgi:hypothetical protein